MLCEAGQTEQAQQAPGCREGAGGSQVLPCGRAGSQCPVPSTGTLRPLPTALAGDTRDRLRGRVLLCNYG